MIIKDETIFIEVSDWEIVGIKHKSVTDGISKKRKSWASIITKGRGNQTLYLYDTLCDKHKEMFAEAVKAFKAEQLTTESQSAIKEREDRERLKACIIIDVGDILPADIRYYQEIGFTAEKKHLAVQYAKRAKWMRYICHSSIQFIRENLYPLKTKKEFYNICLELLVEQEVYDFQTPSFKYLNRLIGNFKKKGLASVVNNRYRVKNALKVTPKVENILKSIIASLNKPSMAQVNRYYSWFLEGKKEYASKETGEVYNPKDYPKLHERTIKKFMEKPEIRAFYDNIHASEIRKRDHSRYLERQRPKHFLSMITCDDWQVPVDMYNGQSIKVYMFFDVATRYCLGWSSSYDKNHKLLKDGLRNLFLNPELQGFTPYELQAESHLVKDLRGDGDILADGQIFNKITVLPKNPQAKYAESDIRNLKTNVLHDNAKFAEYFKGRYYARHEFYKQAKDKQGKTKKLRENEIFSFVDALLTEWNKLHPINATINPNLINQDGERLAFHFGKAINTSFRSGVFQAQNQNYYFENIDTIRGKLKNKHLKVRHWNETAYVYHEDKFLTIAKPVKKVQAALIEQTEEDIKAMSDFYANKAKLDNLNEDTLADRDELHFGEEEHFWDKNPFTQDKWDEEIKEGEKEEEDYYVKLGEELLEQA